LIGPSEPADLPDSLSVMVREILAGAPPRLRRQLLLAAMAGQRAAREGRAAPVRGGLA